jgi:putative addiction module CopG family antidote
MSVSLTPQARERIRRLVESGAYPDEDAVVRDALSLLVAWHERLEALRAKLPVGIDQLDRSESVTFTPEWSAERVRLARTRAANEDAPDREF